MVDGINFRDYLIKNENYLGSDNERPGEHQTDGVLDDDEVKAFFSKSHIDVNGERTTFDRKISQKDFNDWYAANQEAITAYYEEIGLGADAYGNEEYRNGMRDSMLDFVNNDYKEMFCESSFDELEAEQLGLVDKNGILEDNVFLGNTAGTGGVAPVYTTVDFENLNRDEIFGYDNDLLNQYEGALHKMVEVAKNPNNDGTAADTYKDEIVNLFKSQISIAT